MVNCCECTEQYLGTVLDDKLSFEANSHVICRKANQRLFYLKKLRCFNVDKKLLNMFYSSFIESILTFAIIRWFGNLSISNKNKLRNVLKLCQKIFGSSLNDLDSFYKAKSHPEGKGHSGKPSPSSSCRVSASPFQEKVYLSLQDQIK